MEEKFDYIPKMTVCEFMSWLQVTSGLTGWVFPLLVSPVLEWLSPEVMESTSSEEMYRLKSVCHSNSDIY